MTVVMVRSSIRVVLDLEKGLCNWKEKSLQLWQAGRRLVVNVVGRFSINLDYVVELKDVTDELFRKVHFEQKWKRLARILVVEKGGKKYK